MKRSQTVGQGEKEIFAREGELVTAQANEITEVTNEIMQLSVTDVSHSDS